jgi:Domain of unknown function (DUF6429)
MKYDQDKVDEMTLALLYLVTTSPGPEGLGARAWRGFDMNTINRLYEKGWIRDPKTKAMSLYLTDEGFKKSQELFTKYFG